ncbi:hypothetical protein M408DRAFT_9864 [Serendipita vermifera MAFF 305830]|uniref:Uncharacterized protein n=1 Tax=Serendipita vermifera MAFF 305830 TaxID=933852 RepID=A0A0C3APA5_SERVB|nr:hypothetical protein M408DRAFT_9864 [Serendipita vermifera MAFF 305830]
MEQSIISKSLTLKMVEMGHAHTTACILEAFAQEAEEKRLLFMVPVSLECTRPVLLAHYSLAFNDDQTILRNFNIGIIMTSARGSGGLPLLNLYDAQIHTMNNEEYLGLGDDGLNIVEDFKEQHEFIEYSYLSHINVVQLAAAVL